MSLISIGLNHKTASIDIRERFALNTDELREDLNRLRNSPGVQGVLILATCNRTEIYASGEASVKQIILDYYVAKGRDEAIMDCLYIYADEEAVKHIFTVAGGLDSLVLGEGQILHQVKQAFDFAQREKVMDFNLHALFKRAISVGKRVRRDTGIGRSNISVSSAAVAFAQDTLGDLPGKKILIIGAGKISGLTAMALKARGVETVFVANKYYDEAERLAKMVKGNVIHFNQLKNYLTDIDIVISSTSAPHYVLYKSDFDGLIDSRNGKPLFLLDLAVPRDIDPEIGDLPGISLYNVDGLQQAADSGVAARKEEAEKADEIIHCEIERFWRWLDVVPLVASLRSLGAEVAGEQLTIATEKMTDLTEREEQIMSIMAEKIVEKLLAPAIRYISRDASDEKRTTVKEILPEMFNFNKENQ